MTLSSFFEKAEVPLIGDKLAHRKKQMFTVLVGDWFRDASYPWLKEALQKVSYSMAFCSRKRSI